MSPQRDFSKLTELPVNELEILWRTHLGGAMPKHLPKFLLPRLLAYRMQVQVGGGLSKTTERFLHQITNDLEAGRDPVLPYPADQKLKPGSVIMREYDGIQHRVIVIENGYAWQGKTFTSLSSAAKAITGTNWNGQRFFGLKDKGRSGAEAPT